jgi:predicted dehydrogenase
LAKGETNLPTTALNKKEAATVLKVGVIGLVHDHVHWILGRSRVGDIKIVGIVEPNRALASKYAQQYGYDLSIVYDTIEEMLAASQPEAVTAFNAIYNHLEVVEKCAPKGVHVMVEKPLAVSVEHAEKMIALAKKYKIHLLTNFETTWYGSNYKAYDLIHKEQKIGPIRRIIFHTGHPGPSEIGCSKEFLDWLTDPILNGGGALTDFGCYGANLATWLMKGATPLTVSCVTQQIKPEVYPKVEDEATIILTYPKAQIQILASWNWSHSRKEMEVYGKTGYVFCKNAANMEVLTSAKAGAFPVEAQPLKKGLDDPFAFLLKVVNNELELEAFDLSSMENNLIVVKILEAAKEAAQTGKTIIWKDYYGNR